MNKSEKIAYFNSIAKDRDWWKQRNSYYYSELERFLRFIIPPETSLLEIGCGTGDFIGYLQPARGVGVDISPEMVTRAQKKYPEYTFLVDDAEELHLNEKFDYVILSDLVGHLSDVWQAFRELQKVTTPETRVVITYYNYLWEPLLSLGERFGLKMKQTYQNWLSLEDIENLLKLNGYEVVQKGFRLLLPKDIPLLSSLLNRLMAKFPLIKNLCLVEYIVAKEKEGIRDRLRKDYSSSVIIPCKDEAGNIEAAVERTPEMGKHTELIFVDGNSIDSTVEKIEEMIAKYKGKKDIKLIHQGLGKGKGDAVRKGFAAAAGDIFFILDSDLTVPPEDLPKFYLALTEGNGEFINGTRLVYQMEKQAMRHLNLIANKLFSLIFTWLLEQRIKDTLCGTKVLFRRDYEKIAQNRNFFGDFDPFGDFDLLFGAAKLNLKIVEIPIRYRERTYGEIKISRFSHGWLLLKMCGIAFRKLKLN
ncbi:MAG: glycosyltransferase [bacterium]|nr:glycosyltransferase [bacterium]